MRFEQYINDWEEAYDILCQQEIENDIVCCSDYEEVKEYYYEYKEKIITNVYFNIKKKQELLNILDSLCIDKVKELMQELEEENN